MKLLILAHLFVYANRQASEACIEIQSLNNEPSLIEFLDDHFLWLFDRKTK
jgi:hypothetical protein